MPFVQNKTNSTEADFIQSIDQLNFNLEMFEKYLTEGTDVQMELTNNLVKNGRSFVAYTINHEHRFAPSRYIGYANNTPESHNSKEAKHKRGGQTNNRISRILACDNTINSGLEHEYRIYCESLGILPSNLKHKFWIHNTPLTFNNPLESEDFPEGGLVERMHKFRERNRDLVREAKAKFKAVHKRLFCEVCQFDFEKQYGSTGLDFIEAHHLKPVHELEAGHKTKVEDLAMLCSNCHRMAHRTRPWPTIQKLKDMLVYQCKCQNL